MSDEIITINQEQEDQYDYDAIWKDFTRDFWRVILKDFIPDLYKAADLEREAESLDKELHELLADDMVKDEDQINKQSKRSKRYVDNLLKIYLKDGSEEWVLLHIEIQGRGGEMISLRMFRYHCLIFMRHKRHPAAIAILTAKRPKKEGEPGIYSADMFGTKIEYNYHTVKAYEYDDEELLASESPVKLFIYAAKIAAKYRRSDKQKFEYMRKILRVLIDKGWESQDRRRFIMYIESVMSFKKDYSIRFREELNNLTGGKKMRRKTYVEEIYESGIAKGVAQGITQGIAQGIAQGEAMGKARGITQGHKETAIALINLGILTDEQIASVTEQTLEDIAELRSQITV